MRTLGIRPFAVAILLGCMVGLLHSQTTQWTGAVSTDWHNAANWTSGTPNSGVTAVVVAATATSRQPRIASSAACQNLQIQSGGMTIDSVLEVHGSATLRASATGTGRIRFAGVTPTGMLDALGTAASVPTVEIGAGRDILIDVRSITGDLIATSSSARVRWQGDIMILGTVDLRCQSATASAPTRLQVDGSFRVLSRGVAGNLFDELILAGNWVSDANYQATTGTVRLVSGGSHTVAAPGSRLYAIEVDPGQTVLIPNGLVTSGNATVRGSVDVTSSQSMPLDVGGSLSVDGSLLLRGTHGVVRGPMTIRGSATTPQLASQNQPAALRIQGDFATFSGANVVGDFELSANGWFGSDVQGDIHWRQQPTSPVAAQLAGSPHATLAGLTSSGLTNLTIRGLSTTSTRTVHLGLHGSSNLTIGPIVLLAGVTSFRALLMFTGCIIRGDAQANLDCGGLSVSTGCRLQSLPGVVTSRGHVAYGSSNTLTPTTGIIIFSQGSTPGTAQYTFNHGIPNAGSSVVRVDPNVHLYFDTFGIHNITGADIGRLEVAGTVSCSPTGDPVVHELVVRPGGQVTLNAPATQAQVLVESGGSYSNTSSSPGSAVDFIVDGGNVQLGTNLLTVTGNLEVRAPGTLNMPAASVVRLLGSSAHQPIKNLIGRLPLVEVQGGVYHLRGLVADRLTATGPFTLLQVEAATVLGNATFQNLRIDASGPASLLSIGGHATVQTLGVCSTPPNRIECAGNWASNANFQPTAGSLTLTGVGARTITVAAPLAGLSIGNGCQATLNQLDLRGNLTVEGGLTVTGTQHTLRGNVIVASTLTLPAGSTATFAGSGLVDMPATNALPNAVFSAGNWTLRSLTTNGNLTMQTGCSGIEVGSLTVGGTATLLGGSLTRSSSSSQMLVTGTARFTLQSPVVHPPNIEARNDLQLDAAFQPLSGRILLDRTGTGTLTGSSSQIACHELEIRRGSWSPNRSLLVSGNLQVAGQASLNMAGRALTLGNARTLTLYGQLLFGAGGQLVLGNSGTLLANPTSRLRLAGSPSAPVVVNGSNIQCSLQGHVEAVNFEFRGLAAQGVRVRPSATFGSVPEDFRAGRFSLGSPQSGSVLLEIERTTPTSFHELEFDSAGGVTHGAAALGTGRITMVNASGDRAGATHERDPGNILDWALDRTEILGFNARGGFQNIALEVATSRERATSFRVSRAAQEQGPFTVFWQWTPSGNPGSRYTNNDPASTGTQVWYRLEELLPHGAWRLVATTSGRSFPSANTGTTWFVGPGSLPDIGAALQQASAGSRIVVGSGNYPHFTVTRGVSILPAGDGPVVIQATSPVRVVNLSSTGPALTLSGLRISPQAGFTGTELLSLGSSHAVIVLHDVDLVHTGTVDSLRVDRCSQLKIQNLRASHTVRLSNSTAFLDHGSLASLIVQSSSSLTTASTTRGQATVSQGSTLVERNGPSPSLQLRSVWLGGNREDVRVFADPQHLWIVLIDLQPAFQTGLAPIDMVLLLANPNTWALGVNAPPEGALVSMRVPSLSDFQVAMQAVALDPIAVTGRFGTMQPVLLLP